MDIERVDSYKYLGVHLNNKLDCGGICPLLRSGLLGQQHLNGRQEETEQAVKEGRLCPGKPLRPSAGGGRQWLSKLASMLENDSHPMHETLAALGSSFSDRLLHPKCVMEWYRRRRGGIAVLLGRKIKVTRNNKW
ncbi:hypothetical protein NFI96_008573 [Prochilodus magdalenae]|nr:hypothetical protein NFI96_008573 [Prochilodus magdalenae]